MGRQGGQRQAARAQEVAEHAEGKHVSLGGGGRAGEQGGVQQAADLRGAVLQVQGGWGVVQQGDLHLSLHEDVVS